jgi:hypothetical protein
MTTFLLLTISSPFIRFGRMFLAVATLFHVLKSLCILRLDTKFFVYYLWV